MMNERLAARQTAFHDADDGDDDHSDGDDDHDDIDDDDHDDDTDNDHDYRDDDDGMDALSASCIEIRRGSNEL